MLFSVTLWLGRRGDWEEGHELAQSLPIASIKAVHLRLPKKRDYSGPKFDLNWAIRREGL